MHIYKRIAPGFKEALEHWRSDLQIYSRTLKDHHHMTACILGKIKVAEQGEKQKKFCFPLYYCYMHNLRKHLQNVREIMSKLIHRMIYHQTQLPNS